jgi:FMN-dependent oxidoreductase (nitrilotriacetate monooxygenase family)
MHFGLSVAHLGYHPAAWRLPDVPADGTMNFAHYVRCAKIAERGKIDFLFLADVSAVRQFNDPRVARDREQQHAKHEPFILMAALAAQTSKVGFVATASTTFQHPYTLARRLSTIDHISKGRAGWNMVTSWSTDEAANFGMTTTGDSDTRHARAGEFATIVKALCDTWEDDAWTRDKLTGTYFDRTKLHYLDHDGAFFRIKGPLDTTRPPQGVPPLATAGASDNAQEFAAAHANIVYAGQPDINLARTYYASLKGKMAKYGRSTGDILIMPGIMTFVGRTRQEAKDKLERLDRMLDPSVGFGQLLVSGFPDFSSYPLDGPIPDLSPTADKHAAQPSFFVTNLLARARAEGRTVRELIELVCGGHLWQLGMVGTPESIADELEEWFNTGAADGFNIQAATLPGAAEDFVDLVIPELQRRGLFRTDYEGTTLRSHLGLPRPANRFAAAEVCAARAVIYGK